VVLRAAEASEVEQAFLRAREGHAHAVEEVDDRGSHLAHGLGGRLVGEKVAAVDRVVEVLPGRVAFAFGVDRAVDAALRADRVGTLDGHDREEINFVSRLGDLHRRRESRESAADNGNLGSF
jgi:hypothetical protein